MRAHLMKERANLKLLRMISSFAVVGVVTGGLAGEAVEEEANAQDEKVFVKMLRRAKV